MSEQRISADDGTEETGRGVDGGSEDYEATGAFAAEGPVLVGGLRAGVITFGAPNLRGGSYRLCTGAATTVIIQALVGAGPTLSWFRDFIFLGFFTILCASEGSRSFMGGSDVVHCVRLSLTGTTVAASWVHWSVVRDWFVHVNLTL